MLRTLLAIVIAVVGIAILAGLYNTRRENDSPWWYVAVIGLGLVVFALL